ncbi:hypothetical protein SAMN05428977_100157 [Nitrosomonas sp. Nm166]|nr:hypothetical protein SAMN05428977_100157 [Nitrosomonas sp. Nm166]
MVKTIQLGFGKITRLLFCLHYSVAACIKLVFNVDQKINVPKIWAKVKEIILCVRMISGYWDGKLLIH